MMKSNDIHHESGVIFITTLLFVLVIGILSTSLFAWTIYERKQVEMQTNRIIAFHLAEAGIDLAMTQLASDSNYSGTGGTINLGGGAYSAVVTQPDPGGNPSVRRIVSTGFAPNAQNASYAYQERLVTTFVFLTPKSLFNNAIFSEDRTKMTGNSMTDSYNSTLGPYGGVNVNNNGNVASNTVTEGNMEFTGNSRVNGNVTVGLNGNTSEVIELGSNATITGTRTSASSTTNYSAVTVPSGLTSSGEIDLSGNETRVLTAGTYLFDSVDISGNGLLTTLGTVTLYVTGDFEISGNGQVLNAGNLPANFSVNVVGKQEVEISGNGSFYGTFYAPETGKQSEAFKVSGNAQIFGAVVAYEFEASGNAKLHFDETLKNLGGSSQSTVSVLSWQEA